MPWEEAAQLLSGLAREGVLLSIAVGGVDTTYPVIVFPAFQLDKKCHVLPVMTDISTRMPRIWDTEARLLCLTSPSVWLVNQAPADLLEADPDSVLRALDLTVGVT